MIEKAEEIRKILLIKLGGLGDVFLSTIVLDSLRQHFPNAEIDYLVERAGQEAIAHDPRVHSIIAIEKNKTNPVSVILNVRRRQYDVVIDLFGNPRSAIITFCSGARYRVGLDYGWRKYLYSMTGEARREQLHGAEVNLQVLPVLGAPTYSPRLKFSLSADELQFARKFIEEHDLKDRFIIGVLPAGSWPSKRCEPVKFVEILSALVEQFNAVGLIVWGPTDEQDAREISTALESKVILGPRVSLSRNIALLTQCTAIIANDSGPTHIASSFDVPILCIYGPTFPEGPYGNLHSWVRNEQLSCLVCNLLHCPIEHQCMMELPVRDVVEAFRRMVTSAGHAVPALSKRADWDSRK